MTRLTTLLALCVWVAALLANLSVNTVASDIRVLPEKVDGIPTGELMHKSLMAEAEQRFDEWHQRYEAVKTVEQAKAYQQRQKQFFFKQLGPLPERTSLNAVITGRVSRPSVNVEKVVFESRPKHYVTGAMFLPDEKRFPKPWPGVLVVCGHSAGGKAEPAYQSVSMLLAINGMAAFLVDPICQGERLQFLDQCGKPLVKGATVGHSVIGLGSILLGKNTASFEVWDGMRAIDYLQSRGDIVPTKIGCTGNSGGGTQTAYLMALDDRIQVAVPSCYITSFARLLNTIGPQDAEQNIFNQVGFGMDHADYILMRAPKPTLLCVATQDFFDIHGAWHAFRSAKRFYARHGLPERVGLAENDDRHGFKQPLREAAVQWLKRWLTGRDVRVKEPQLEVLKSSEIQCTESGQVQTWPGAVTVLDLNRAELSSVRKTRNDNWTALSASEKIALVRNTAGMRDRNGSTKREWGGVDRQTISEFSLPTFDQEIRAETMVLKAADGFPLPGLILTPGNAKRLKDRRIPIVVVLHPGGINHALKHSVVHGSLEEGMCVAAFDLRGLGETSPRNGVWYRKRFGQDGKEVTIAYLLGKSFVGMRADDIGDLSVSLAKLGYSTEIYALGDIGVAALHAAAGNPNLFRKTTVDGTLTSFAALLDAPREEDQWRNIVHGVLQQYDLPHLVKELGDSVEVINPWTPYPIPTAR